MSLKETIKFEREHLTPEHLKFNRTVLIPLIILFTCAPVVVLAVCLLLGLKFGESVITFIPLFVWAAALAVFVILFAVKVRKVNKSVIATRAAELEEKYADIPLETAKEILIADKVITEDGFVCLDEVFGETILPFDKAVFAFGVRVISTVIYLQIAVGSLADGNIKILFDNLQIKAIYNLNGALFNFLTKSGFDLSGNEYFELLKNDKKAFAEKILKGGKRR